MMLSMTGMEGNAMEKNDTLILYFVIYIYMYAYVKGNLFFTVRLIIIHLF